MGDARWQTAEQPSGRAAEQEGFFTVVKNLTSRKLTLDSRSTEREI
jgi:hypothetical protein